MALALPRTLRLCQMALPRTLRLRQLALPRTLRLRQLALHWTLRLSVAGFEQESEIVSVDLAQDFEVFSWLCPRL